MTRPVLVPVLVGSEIFGDTSAILTSIEWPWLRVVLPEPIPLGSVVSVHFICTRLDGQSDELVARARVANVRSFNAGTNYGGSERSYDLKVIDFDNRPPLDLPDARRLH